MCAHLQYCKCRNAFTDNLAVFLLTGWTNYIVFTSVWKLVTEWPMASCWGIDSVVTQREEYLLLHQQHFLHHLRFTQVPQISVEKGLNFTWLVRSDRIQEVSRTAGFTYICYTSNNFKIYSEYLVLTHIALWSLNQSWICMFNYLVTKVHNSAAVIQHFNLQESHLAIRFYKACCGENKILYMIVFHMHLFVACLSYQYVCVQCFLFFLSQDMPEYSMCHIKSFSGAIV